MNRSRWLALAILLLLPLSSWAEVHYVPAEGEVDPDRVIISYFGGGGGGEDDANPWPTVNGHLPPHHNLNPLGGDKEPPDGFPVVGYNPAGYFEVFWASHDGEDYEIVRSYWDGEGWTDPEPVTNNFWDDKDPDVSYAPDGSTRVSWWSQLGIEMRTRGTDGEWGPFEIVDLGVLPSVGKNVLPTVGYQKFQYSMGNRAIVYGWKDGGTWNLTTLATTTFEGFDLNGELDVRLNSKSGHTWIVWEDSPNVLGWCEIVNNACMGTFYEPLMSIDEEEPVRFQIEMQVLSP